MIGNHYQTHQNVWVKIRVPHTQKLISQWLISANLCCSHYDWYVDALVYDYNLLDKAYHHHHSAILNFNLFACTCDVLKKWIFCNCIIDYNGIFYPQQILSNILNSFERSLKLLLLIAFILYYFNITSLAAPLLLAEKNISI